MGIAYAIATFKSTTVTAVSARDAWRSRAMLATATVTEVLTTVPARPAHASSAARRG
jgi:hypothetical protein